MTDKQTTINMEEIFSLEKVVGYKKTRSVIEKIHRWAQARSLWPYYMGSGCCNRSMDLVTNDSSDYSDYYKIMESFGVRQADLLIISGAISFKRFEEVKKVYDQMPAPKWVMVVGACASSGGLFEKYASTASYYREIPVDVFVPGCPPSPENIIKGFEMIRTKIRRCGFRDQL